MIKRKVIQIVEKYRASARKKRAKLFLQLFSITTETKIIDLGSADGSYINSVLSGTRADPKKIFIADISERYINIGAEKYGYQPVLIQEKGSIDFPDKYFDIVFCSSVIEHVTLPKEEVWNVTSGLEFKIRSLEHQKQFAQEILRIGKYYFVQTPYPFFPIESHTWFPLFWFLPRVLQIKLHRFLNRFWIKTAAPDFNLLDKAEIEIIFPNSTIIEEKSFGFVKSLMITSKK